MSLVSLKDLFYSFHYLEIFLGVLIAFSFIYFMLAALTLSLTHCIFPKLRIGRIIDQRERRPKQIQREIKLSFISIAIFAIFGPLTLWLNKIGWVHIIWSITWSKFLLDLVVIFLWNEFHFYCCHRFLHISWFFKKVHYLHHASIVPTPFSTFSFHWFEALLLSSVMVTVMFFYDFSIVMLLFFPVVSLVINNIGHMNYAVFPEKSSKQILASCKRHTKHHGAVNGNYGFFLPWLDSILKTRVD